jgi:hypothetical protein
MLFAETVARFCANTGMPRHTKTRGRSFFMNRSFFVMVAFDRGKSRCCFVNV